MAAEQSLLGSPLTGKPLAGKTLVVTRPAKQSAAICTRLEGLGAKVLKFPLIGIAAPAHPQRCQAQLTDLADYDCVIFISRNAVERAFECIAQAALFDDVAALFAGLTVAAVGKQTAQALHERGVVVAVVPDATFNSEALLKHTALQTVAAQKIAIVRGQGGRERLRDCLVARGARVTYIEVYQRVCPASDLLPLVKHQRRQGIDIILLTSVAGLTHLMRLGSGQAWLADVALLVGSQRLADALREMNHRGPVMVADDPSDERMVQCLLDGLTAG